MSTGSAEPGPAVGPQQPPSMLAAAGVTSLLIGALGALAVAPALMPPSYSWVEHGVSESAAQGVDGAWLARAGMILYGLAVLWLVGLRHRAWGPLATALHTLFGVSTLAVAAFATRPWEEGATFVESESTLHDVFASTAGFGFVTGLLALIVQRRQRTVAAASWDWVALVVAAAVPLAGSTGIWGLLQRAMFVVAAAWYARETWDRVDGPAPVADQASESAARRLGRSMGG